MLFNLHTHKPKYTHQEIYNIRIGDVANNSHGLKFFSAGIHPWDVDSLVLEKALCSLKSNLLKENCIALGEFGLDKVCQSSFNHQKLFLREQLKLAKDCGIDVLIIHCVKSYQELMKEKKNCKHDFVWILHAFNGSKELITQLNKLGFYFSLGEAILNSKTKISKSASHIPLDRLFLETDDSGFQIEEIYQKFSEIWQVSFEELQSTIGKNVKKVFPTLLLDKVC